MTKSIIWDTIEAICWARGLPYEEYCQWHNRAFPDVEAETPEFYAGICKVFEEEMERDDQLERKANEIN